MSRLSLKRRQDEAKLTSSEEDTDVPSTQVIENSDEVAPAAEENLAATKGTTATATVADIPLGDKNKRSTGRRAAQKPGCLQELSDSEFDSSPEEKRARKGEGSRDSYYYFQFFLDCISQPSAIQTLNLIPVFMQ
jgi:hypothetical protein